MITCKPIPSWISGLLIFSYLFIDGDVVGSSRSHPIHFSISDDLWTTPDSSYTRELVFACLLVNVIPRVYYRCIFFLLLF
jgi:hypothetical protein